MQIQSIIGFYGKLPMQTNIVSGNLPTEFIQPWQTWLQNALACSHEKLGSAWLDSYLTSPIWRFILSSGLCGDHAWAGIVMPSMDKQGNYFPLTLAAPFNQSSALPYLFTLAHNWFEQLENVALHGLENDHLDLTQFVHALRTIPVFPLTELSSLETLPYLENQAGKKSVHIRITDFNQLPNAFIPLSSGLLDSFASHYSLWLSSGSELVYPSLSFYEGLPPAHCFADFLNSNVVHKTTTKWSSWSMTDIGKRRQCNEDALLDKPDVNLWAVADGMGGHKAGDVASQFIVNALDHLALPSADTLTTRVYNIQHCLQQANQQLQHFAQKNYRHDIVGSTVVVFVSGAEEHCAALWAGDSRLYRLRQQTLEQLTQDHSADSTNTMETNNIITKAVGVSDYLELDCVYFDALVNDIYLLCSDGLYKELSFAEIEFIMKNHPANDIADSLINKALERGARDNISLIVTHKQI